MNAISFWNWFAAVLLGGVFYIGVGLAILTPIRDVRFWRKVRACPAGRTFPLLIWPVMLVAWLLRNRSGAFD